MKGKHFDVFSLQPVHKCKHPETKHRGVYVTLPQHDDKLKSKNRLDFLWYAVTVKTLSSEVLEYFGIVISFYSPWLDLTHQPLSGKKEQCANKMLYKDAVWQCKKSQFDTRLDPPITWEFI